MAKVTHQKCPKCGAPLTLTPGVADVACEYCRTVVHVEWGKKAPVEQPPPLTIYVKNPLPAFVPVLIALAVILPLGIAAIVFFVSMFGGAASSAVQAVQAVQLAGGQQSVVAKSLPAVCGLNQELVISGQKFEGPGPLVTAEVNCKVKIKDSTLKSDVVVLAKNLGEITIENSTLEGKEAAVKLAMNSKLFLKKKARLLGEEAAVTAGVNNEITLEEASIEGVEDGIKGETNLKVSGTKSTITGKQYGLRSTGSNLTVEGKELGIKGGRAAIESQHNLKLDLRGGSVEGEENAILIKGSNGELRLTRGAQVKGKEVAVKGETNLHIEMEDALIDAKEIAVQAGVNPKFSLGPKARIHGGRIALKVGINLELEMRDATIESEGVAICAPFNIEIQARNSKLSGGSEAFRFERKPNQLELTQTNVTGKQSFAARGCGATP